MDEIEIKEKLASEVEYQYRLEEMITSIKNRIKWEQSRVFFSPSYEEKKISEAKIDAYTGVLGVIQKEMLMELPYDEMLMVENKIKRTRDSFIDVIIDLENYRGTQEYNKMFILKRKLATAIENAIYYYFEMGYKHGKGENINIG